MNSRALSGARGIGRIESGRFPSRASVGPEGRTER